MTPSLIHPGFGAIISDELMSAFHPFLPLTKSDLDRGRELSDADLTGLARPVSTCFQRFTTRVRRWREKRRTAGVASPLTRGPGPRPGVGYDRAAAPLREETVRISWLPL